MSGAGQLQLSAIVSATAKACWCFKLVWLLGAGAAAGYQNCESPAFRQPLLMYMHDGGIVC